MDDEIYVVIHSALIMVSNFNSREVMAVILHEIGHNFVDSPSHILSRILNFSIGSLLVAPQAVFMEMMVSMGLFGAFDVINFKKIFFKAKELVNKTTLKFPFVANTLYLLADLQFNVSYLTSLFSFRLDLIPRILMFGSIGRMVYTYDIEKASDSFAVDHGYGPDLATGLDKLMMMEKSFNGQMASKVKPYGLLVDVLEIQMETVSSIFSGYPSKQNRIRSLLDRAESNLAKDKSLSPTQKKQLQKDIKDMETFYYDQYLNIESDRNKHRYLSVVTANMIEHMYKGKADIRELFFNPDKR
jgi:Zn-dependent protease with chaperone function